MFSMRRQVDASDLSHRRLGRCMAAPYDEDEALARAIELSLQEAQPPPIVPKVRPSVIGAARMPELA